MKTIDQMVAWLQERGVTTARSNLSHFLKRQREEAGRKALREQLTAKANKLNEVEEWLAKNPKPEPGMVMDIFKMQVLELAADAGMDPQRLKLADKLARTAMGFVNDQGRETYRTRRLAMEEAKHLERVKRGRTRIATVGLGQVKKAPTMAELFRRVFATLNKSQEADR